MAFDGYRFKFKFNASHYIDILHPETIHSHTFHIIVYLENDNNNFIIYNEIEKAINNYLDQYRGKCLNLIYPFNEISPTLENICKVMYQHIESYCNQIYVLLDKLSISDNSIIWYSLGNGLLIDSLNENIQEHIFANYIHLLNRKYSFIDNNQNENYSIFDDVECISTINERKSNVDNQLDNYLEKENIDFYKNKLPTQDKI